MASSHVNRENGPNTWPLRPKPQSEDLLANPEPSTHCPSRHVRRHAYLVVNGAKRTSDAGDDRPAWSRMNPNGHRPLCKRP